MPEREPTTTLHVNGTSHEVALPPTTPLMYVLRNDLGCPGVRSGCAIGECGACRILLDGVAVPSCITPLSEAAGAQVVTPEGLGGPDDPHPVQRAFLDEQAGQCGYCVNGMIVSVAGRLQQDRPVDAAALRETLDDHLCRCGTHTRMLRAACRAAGLPTNPATGPDPVMTDGGGQPPVPGSDAGFQVPAAVRDEPRIEGWIALREDGAVVLRSGKVELGQGLRTALAQIAAAQLGTDVARIEVAPTATGAAPDQAHTSGSFSIEHAGVAIAMAAVALRRVLFERAAIRLGGDATGLRLDGDAVVSEDGARVSLADLLAEGPCTGAIEDTDVPRFDVSPLGDPVHRDDLRTKLTGAPAYVHDLDLPGTRYARALLPPTLDAELVAVDTDAVRALPGVEAVVVDGRLVVVVAAREDQAVRAIGRLQADTRWERGAPLTERDTEQLLRGLDGEEAVAQRDAGAAALLGDGAGAHAATYVRPYQAHGPMAGSAAVALQAGSTLHLWTHSQGIYPLRREVAALLDVAEDDIQITHVDGPGCYGMNGADDAAAVAAIAARAVPGQPVRFQFSTADEFTWEPHGPGMVADLRAALDDDGRIVAWGSRTITDSHSTRPDGSGDRLLPAWIGDVPRERPWVGLGEPGLRNAVPQYDIPALDVVAHEVRGPLRTGPLRSLGAFFNLFAVESFVDELAEAAGADPVAFRLAHVRDERAAAVLTAAADRAGWQPRVGPSGRGLGVALGRYKDTKAYAAVVAAVAVDPAAGSFRVARLVVACDAGTVINADGLRNQLEGGALQGLSRTLFEELHLADDGTLERDWTTYGSLRFRDVPDVEVVVLDRPGHPPLGAGEVTTPLVPAAVANAIDDAIGIRLRTLPLTAGRLERRLLEMEASEAARVLV